MTQNSDTAGPLLLSPLTLDAIQAKATGLQLRNPHRAVTDPAATNANRIAQLFSGVYLAAGHLNDYASDRGVHPGIRDQVVSDLLRVAADAASWIQLLEAGRAE